MLNGRLGKNVAICNQPLIWVWRGLWHNKKTPEGVSLGVLPPGIEPGSKV